MIRNFLDDANHGRLNSAPLRSAYAPLDSQYLSNVFLNVNALPAGLRRISPTSPDIRRPVDRVFEALGSNTNRYNMMLVARDINSVKGAIFGRKQPMGTDKWNTMVKDLKTTGNQVSLNRLLSIIRTVRSENDPG